ncbi:hypothetical protein [Candidatus Entotheonella palauensis]|uniref:DUF465 domain-containing protein n=1 Tax=Candidatus Entotheonella gemina TaxID=1429439 RepID=W4L712_9BACT|nr:hypothetical protein [Candidatus Entotheonella palauensis]ETW93470.1 MAG: hypothetical protein ETSY2_51370 [Candidatus Entotheonella gemina]
MLDGIDTALIERAQQESDEFCQLLEAHQAYEAQLSAYDELSYLSEAQEVERKRLQKLKLQGKDRMVAILNQYQLSKS